MERLDINITQSWNKNVRYSGIRLRAGVTIPEHVVNPIKKPDTLYKRAGSEDKIFRRPGKYLQRIPVGK